MILKIIFTVIAIFLTLLAISFMWSLSLKKQVAQRTEELQNEVNERKRIELDLRNAKTTLEDAYQKAEAANRTKSQFLANMSHELRTPLNGILGYAQIFARDKSLTNKQQEGTRIIQRSGEYLLSLINDILDISKIEAQHTQLQLTDFDFIAFLHAVNELIEIRARQKGINFIYEPAPNLPQLVHADEKRLRQVLINLLDNAVKFTQHGGVTLRVSYQVNQLSLQIIDTGIGIAAKDLELIFQPFQQVSSSLNDKTEGTGLGLSITKKLVDMMSGQLRVTSELGQGSQFSILLPLTEVAQSAMMKIEKTAVITGFTGMKKKILVIDDKWENCSVINHLLTPLGFEINEANNGQEGLAKLNEVKPDLIMTDLVMPVMDGFEFMRQIKKMPQFSSIPVIALSASYFDYQPQSNVEYAAFIPKPFQVDDLLTVLQQQLDLTWLYDTDNQETSQQTEQSIKEIQQIDHPILCVLTPEQVDVLFTLGMEGDVRGLLKATQKLKQENPELQPLMDLIAQRAEQFDTDGVCELLKQYKNK